MTARHRYVVACLAGHGIGPEVTAAASRALARLGREHGFDVEELHPPFDTEALTRSGHLLPPTTRHATATADAVLVAVGKPRFLHADMVKPGAAVIDIGINQITGPNGETLIVGDVDTDGVKEVASWVTPVPGGVGPVTVAMFMRNAIAAHTKQLAAGWLG